MPKMKMVELTSAEPDGSGTKRTRNSEHTASLIYAMPSRVAWPKMARGMTARTGHSSGANAAACSRLRRPGEAPMAC